ncbi:hypothetical protein NP233_g1725 [Leucocoprinus birnbaumii]|uniref:Uncharacterized protein n=1 Tax=Leucocoprinus birnbaumii TaxID=56174 RepID=A0AAD5W2M0_9AGAR|nr:hypothetical protein NP233_g1725 [Leucocoprinus birnbaumii]
MADRLGLDWPPPFWQTKTEVKPESPTPENEATPSLLTNFHQSEQSATWLSNGSQLNSLITTRGPPALATGLLTTLAILACECRHGSSAANSSNKDSRHAEDPAKPLTLPNPILQGVPIGVQTAIVDASAEILKHLGNDAYATQSRALCRLEAENEGLTIENKDLRERLKQFKSLQVLPSSSGLTQPTSRVTDSDFAPRDKSGIDEPVDDVFMSMPDATTVKKGNAPRKDQGYLCLKLSPDELQRFKKHLVPAFCAVLGVQPHPWDNNNPSLLKELRIIWDMVLPMVPRTLEVNGDEYAMATQRNCKHRARITNDVMSAVGLHLADMCGDSPSTIREHVEHLLKDGKARYMWKTHDLDDKFEGLFLAPYIIAGITAHLEMTATLSDELKVLNYPHGALALSTVAAERGLIAWQRGKNTYGEDISNGKDDKFSEANWGTATKQVRMSISRLTKKKWMKILSPAMEATLLVHGTPTVKAYDSYSSNARALAYESDDKKITSALGLSNHERRCPDWTNKAPKVYKPPEVASLIVEKAVKRRKLAHLNAKGGSSNKGGANATHAPTTGDSAIPVAENQVFDPPPPPPPPGYMVPSQATPFPHIRQPSRSPSPELPTTAGVNTEVPLRPAVISKTIRNTFGLYREYTTFPQNDPEDAHTLDDHCVSPNLTTNPSGQPRRWWAGFGSAIEKVKEFYAPFMNPTTYRLMKWFYTSTTKSLSDLYKLVRHVLVAPDFNSKDLKGFSAEQEGKSVDMETGMQETNSGVFTKKNFWKVSSVELKIPFEESNTREAKIRHRPSPFMTFITAVWNVIEAAFQDPAAASFHYVPHKLFCQKTPDAPPERLFSELYNSDAFLEEWHAKLQQNQSKYERLKPSNFAAHHIAYISEREFIHAIWTLLLDEDLRHAYEHGIPVDCADGVRHLLFPRFFTYSADYSEKALLATIRVLGGCPCPRCKIKKDQIGGLGTDADAAIHEDTRSDNKACRKLVDKARKIIFNKAKGVASSFVENLLKPLSLVPTRNLNKRYRLTPTFGQSTIRRFSEDASSMKKLAGRDFEDLLQLDTIDFLWARWFIRDDRQPCKFSDRRLPLLEFADDGAFGFLEPDNVLRGCHLIPAYARGQVSVLGKSICHRPDDDYRDWQYHYVNISVDRDMFMSCENIVTTGGTAHCAGNSATSTSREEGTSSNNSDPSGASNCPGDDEQESATPKKHYTADECLECGYPNPDEEPTPVINADVEAQGASNDEGSDMDEDGEGRWDFDQPEDDGYGAYN